MAAGQRNSLALPIAGRSRFVTDAIQTCASFRCAGVPANVLTARASPDLEGQIKATLARLQQLGSKLRRSPHSFRQSSPPKAASHTSAQPSTPSVEMDETFIPLSPRLAKAHTPFVTLVPTTDRIDARVYGKAED